ncbi:MAG: hypothetical protein HOU01_14355, partial [Streptomycetaceae bacterium]|nr:hypothetical protein [Streptomycetaceae bacterium]
RDGGDDPSGGVLEDAPDAFTLIPGHRAEFGAGPDYYSDQYADKTYVPDVPGKVYK